MYHYAAKPRLARAYVRRGVARHALTSRLTSDAEAAAIAIGRRVSGISRRWIARVMAMNSAASDFRRAMELLPPSPARDAAARRLHAVTEDINVSAGERREGGGDGGGYVISPKTLYMLLEKKSRAEEVDAATAAFCGAALARRRERLAGAGGEKLYEDDGRGSFDGGADNDGNDGSDNHGSDDDDDGDGSSRHDAVLPPWRESEDMPSLVHGVTAGPIPGEAAAGTGLITGAAFLPGEPLLKETAYAAAIHRDHRKTHCHHCFVPLPLAPIPCRVRLDTTFHSHHVILQRYKYDSIDDTHSMFHVTNLTHRE